MTPEQIAADIERGDFLSRRIKTDKEELKAIEKRLESAGLNVPHIPLKEQDREGKQAILKCGERTLPVVYESDLLIGSFAAAGIIHTTLTNIVAPEIFKGLFKEVHQFERRQDDGQKFRVALRKAIADEPLRMDILNVLKARSKDGITKSKTVIAWDRLTPSAIPA